MTTTNKHIQVIIINIFVLIFPDNFLFKMFLVVREQRPEYISHISFFFNFGEGTIQIIPLQRSAGVSCTFFPFLHLSLKCWLFCHICRWNIHLHKRFNLFRSPPQVNHPATSPLSPIIRRKKLKIFLVRVMIFNCSGYIKLMICPIFTAFQDIYTVKKHSLYYWFPIIQIFTLFLFQFFLGFSYSVKSKKKTM